MEGQLLKKTTGGQWHSRQFTLVGPNLTWLKSDGKTTLTVDVRGAEIRDMKIGPKKFAFEIILPGDTVSVAASGEAEKAAWIAALKVAMGKRDEAEGILQQSGAGRASVRSLAKFTPGSLPKPGAAASPAKSPTSAPAVATSAAAAPSAAPASPASPISPTPMVAPKTEVGSMVTGGLASQAANAKLAAKLGGKIGTPQQAVCVVCGQTVYKPEELVVDKAVMHKRCFQCAHCKRLLTMGNFACINGTFYCKVHYFELFSTNGGKYDKAFGDAGFKTKATTSYTPGEVLQPGKLAGKPATTPPKTQTASPTKQVTETKIESPAAPTAAAPTNSEPVSPTASKKSPKKLEIKAPVSTKTVEKKEVEVIPKKNMDDLRKMVVLPGMQPPKPKKEVPAEVPTEAKEEKPEDAQAEIPNADEVKPADASPKETPEAEATPAVDEGTPRPEMVGAAAEPIQIVRPPGGINFAVEAMRIRQAQLSKAGVVMPPPEEPTQNEEGRASVRISGRLDHSAVLSKPKMAGRRAPKVQEVGKLLPKAEIDRMTHDWTFRVMVDGTSANVLVVHATSQFEREHWVATISANVYMLGLKRDLEAAQKKDMMSALQAQLALEAFVTDNKVTYQGFLEKVSMKSQRNWKKRWFTLNDKGELSYFENENSKKPKQTLNLSHLTVITSADGTRLDAPLVINTGAAERSEETGGQLPQNIAIFDNEDVTIDLETIIPEELKSMSTEPTAEADVPANVAEPIAAEAESAPSEPTAAIEAPVGGDDFVVVEKAEAAQETQKPDESERADASEEKASDPNAEPEGSPSTPKADTDSDANITKVNTAWATPGKSPDRIAKAGDVPLNDASPQTSPEGKMGSDSRRKSGGQKPKNCVVM